MKYKFPRRRNSSKNTRLTHVQVLFLSRCDLLSSLTTVLLLLLAADALLGSRVWRSRRRSYRPYVQPVGHGMHLYAVVQGRQRPGRGHHDPLPASRRPGDARAAGRPAAGSDDLRILVVSPSLESLLFSLVFVLHCKTKCVYRVVNSIVLF